MKVSDVMTRDVQLIEPTQTIRNAARLMAEMDAGIMPVREGDRLVGMITDRDIAVRAVAEGKGPDTPIREVMTEDVKYCYEDDDTNDVARNMADIQVRRLPVLTRDKRLVVLSRSATWRCRIAPAASAKRSPVSRSRVGSIARLADPGPELGYGAEPIRGPSSRQVPFR
jgi:predicted transcriptional regulator